MYVRVFFVEDYVYLFKQKAHKHTVLDSPSHLASFLFLLTSLDLNSILCCFFFSLHICRGNNQQKRKELFSWNFIKKSNVDSNREKYL